MSTPHSHAETVKKSRRYCSHRDNKWNGIVTKEGIDYCGTCDKEIKPGTCSKCWGCKLVKLLSGLLAPCPVCCPEKYGNTTTAEGRQ